MGGVVQRGDRLLGAVGTPLSVALKPGRRRDLEPVEALIAVAACELRLNGACLPGGAVRRTRPQARRERAPVARDRASPRGPEVSSMKLTVLRVTRAVFQGTNSPSTG